MYKKLIEIRKKKGLTQEDMARLINISPEIYNKKEMCSYKEKNGKKYVTVDFTPEEVIQILKALEVQYNDIFLRW